MGGRTLLGLLTAVLVACAGPSKLAAVNFASEELGGAARVGVLAAREAAIDRALAEATLLVDRALPQIASPAFRRATYVAAVRHGDLEAASRVRAFWIPDATNLKDAVHAVNHAALTGRFDSARSLAWSAVDRFETEREALMRLWYATWLAEPSFRPPAAALGIDGPIDRIRPLGGGSSLVFRLDSDGTTLAAFKPNQSRLQSNFRAEIAAYRLCALIHCAFEVPHNREVRIERSVWNALHGATTVSEGRAVGARYPDLVWTRDEAGREWLHGTAKSWVLQFTLFGIESRAVWDPLVEVDPTEEVEVDELMSQLLSGSNGVDLTGLDSDALARQLSNLHVFDFLLNNWDRYSSRFPGVNCQWRQDHFVSIDNGAAFPLPRYHGTTAQRVERNLRGIERFSRKTIDAVRWMPTDVLFGILFPETRPEYEEKTRFEAFLRRRQQLIDRVDGLISEHGEDAVLAFP